MVQAESWCSDARFDETVTGKVLLEIGTFSAKFIHIYSQNPSNGAESLQNLTFHLGQNAMLPSRRRHKYVPSTRSKISQDSKVTNSSGYMI